MEQEQRVIDQLQNDLHLIDMTRVPADNLIESQEGPSDLEPIEIEETTGSDNPEVSMPQVGSLGGFWNHPKTSKEIRERKCTKPLTKLNNDL
jgi:hypothetical protein